MRLRGKTRPLLSGSRIKGERHIQLRSSLNLLLEIVYRARKFVGIGSWLIRDEWNEPTDR